MRTTAGCLRARAGWGLLLALLVGACGGGGGDLPDGGDDAAMDGALDTAPAPGDATPPDTTPPPDASDVCAEDRDCADGAYCNGAELCNPRAPSADAFGCTASAPPCRASVCDEDADTCRPECDVDGDDHLSTDCGGDDCDDASASTRPGQVEVCNGIDDDCDGTVDEGVSSTYYPDGDGDGFGDGTAASVQACARPAGYSDTATDCDDERGAVNPASPEVCDAAATDEDCDGMANEDCECAGAETRPCAALGACAAGLEQCAAGSWGACSISPTTEVCNGVDDDCDGTVDDGVTVTCYPDADNDAYAPMGATSGLECPVAGRGAVGGCPFGTTDRDPATDADCDDTSPVVRPGGTEVCDASAVDEDCDGTANEGCACASGATRACDLPGRCAAGTQTCLGGDWGACSIGPVTEVCNAVDDDCDGTVDDGVTVTCYADADDDTYAASGATASEVCPVSGRSAVGGCPLGTTDRPPTTADCDDARSDVSPAGTEICDVSGRDEDCDGSANEGCACSSGEIKACAALGVCALGTQTCAAGTWGVCSIQPVSETCNGADDDCDGATDEGC